MSRRVSFFFTWVVCVPLYFIPRSIITLLRRERGRLAVCAHPLDRQREPLARPRSAGIDAVRSRVRYSSSWSPCSPLRPNDGPKR
eukprot:4749382-Prymnesium_polylepis.1